MAQSVSQCTCEGLSLYPQHPGKKPGAQGGEAITEDNDVGLCAHMHTCIFPHKNREGKEERTVFPGSSGTINKNTFAGPKDEREFDGKHYQVWAPGSVFCVLYMQEM